MRVRVVLACAETACDEIRKTRNAATTKLATVDLKRTVIASSGGQMLRSALRELHCWHCSECSHDSRRCYCGRSAHALEISRCAIANCAPLVPGFRLPLHVRLRCRLRDPDRSSSQR